MANMITNSKAGQSNGNSTNGSSLRNENMRKIYSFIEENVSAMNLAPGGNYYDHIVEMIRGLDLQDDGIVMNRKIKAIETDFCNIVHDENMLCESMSYINAKALDDGEIALKFALLFSSRNFDALAMKETKVRSAMLKILETNFMNADTFRMCDKDRLYNSITLLGEYYHRVRLADNSPITILGESLIGLLVREIEGQDVIDSKFAKLVLSQMTLNGDIMRLRHHIEITQLLYHIRRHMVEQPKLTSTTKALLLMTLDLYYSNFENLGSELETFYTKYLVHGEQHEGNNNQTWLPQQQSQQQPNNEELQQQQPQPLKNVSEIKDSNTELPDSQPPITTKKWSEQVCEDSLYETEYVPEYENLDESHSTTASDCLNSTNTVPNVEKDIQGARRTNGPRSPRPLKQTVNNNRNSREQLNNNPQFQPVNGEEADQSKPLPRWRAARFNRDEEQNNEYARNRNRRFSGSMDDDHQSVRSEGGSIRLYSINDRLKHSQEKIDRTSNNNYSFMVNSNWDQSQRDDRSERSYISNYEYGNKQRRGYRNYNNRQSYDKPPRFQKNRKDHQQQQHPQQQQPQSPQQGPQSQQPPMHDNKHYNDNWRRARTNSNNSYNEDYDEARATTLPRPTKSNFEGSIKSASFRRSQSPTHQREYNRHQQHRGNTRNYNGRYGSQNSIHSEDGGEHRGGHHTQRHNNNRGGRRFNMPNRGRQQQPQQTQGENNPDNWNRDRSPAVANNDENSELVRNARQTTNYMNYLSSK